MATCVFIILVEAKMKGLSNFVLALNRNSRDYQLFLIYRRNNNIFISYEVNSLHEYTKYYSLEAALNINQFRIKEVRRGRRGPVIRYFCQ